MLISLIIIFLITLGGLAITYLYEEKESPLMVRMAAGNVIGSALFSLSAFLLACVVGFSTVTIIISLVITLTPLLFFLQLEKRRQFFANFNKAKGKLDGANLSKFLRFAYYTIIFIVFWFFFERAMLIKPEGIFTGASQNLGDLPFHLGAIFSFTEGLNFPPENPSYSNAKFTYPFIADFITACFHKLGASVNGGMFVQNVTLAFSLLILFERFVEKLTKNKLAGKIAPFLFLFCGGLGFLAFFRDYSDSGRSFFEFIFNLKRDYTINEQTFRWGNSLVVLFITQRSLLLGLPLTLIVLTKLWELINQKTNEETNKIALLTIGLLAGTLPLIHVHSLVVLFVICGILFFYTWEKWQEWLIFGGAVCLIAVPELVWSLTGSATSLSKFIEWHFGWDKGNQNFFVFWLVNLGIFIPLLIASFFALPTREDDEEEHKTGLSSRHLIFYVPFLLCFIIPNLVKLAPWEWDNIKVLVYWYVGSVPFVAWFLAIIWEKKSYFRIITVGLVLCLTLSGMIDVWRTMTGVINYQIFHRDAVKIAELIKQKTEPKAMFLNAPTYNSAVVLSGRRSFMRYSGHLSSYGIDYQPREDEVKRIYEGSALAEDLLKKNAIEYVLISPEEFSNLPDVNEEFFRRYQLFAQAGEYKVYKIR